MELENEGLTDTYVENGAHGEGAGGGTGPGVVEHGLSCRQRPLTPLSEAHSTQATPEVLSAALSFLKLCHLPLEIFFFPLMER